MHKRKPQLQTVAAQFLLGITGLALITLVCFWVGFHITRTAFAYLVLIALVSLLGSFTVSVVLSLVAVACLNYFFAPPLFDFRADDPEDTAPALFVPHGLPAGCHSRLGEADVAPRAGEAGPAE